MKILAKIRRVRGGQFVSYQVFFDIVLRSFPNFEESKEEINKKGTQFRDKVNNLKPRGSWVGNFMPMSKDRKDTYAFFVITCSSGSSTKIKDIISKSIEDGDVITFR